MGRKRGGWLWGMMADTTTLVERGRSKEESRRLGKSGRRGRTGTTAYSMFPRVTDYSIYEPCRMILNRGTHCAGQIHLESLSRPLFLSRFLSTVLSVLSIQLALALSLPSVPLTLATVRRLARTDYPQSIHRQKRSLV